MPVVQGGEVAALAVDALRGQPGIFVGSVSTTGTVFFPSAAVAAWDAYIATATATLLSSVPAGARNAEGSTSAARGLRVYGVQLLGVVVGMLLGAVVVMV